MATWVSALTIPQNMSESVRPRALERQGSFFIHAFGMRAANEDALGRPDNSLTFFVLLIQEWRAEVFDARAVIIVQNLANSARWTWNMNMDGHGDAAQLSRTPPTTVYSF
jgi:hypothetical protein